MVEELSSGSIESSFTLMLKSSRRVAQDSILAVFQTAKLEIWATIFAF